MLEDHPKNISLIYLIACNLYKLLVPSWWCRRLHKLLAGWKRFLRWENHQRRLDFVFTNILLDWFGVHIYVGRGWPPHPFSNILLWRGGDFPMGQWGPVHVHAVGGGRTEQQRRWGDLYRSFLHGSALILIIILLSWCLLPGLHRHEQPQLLQLAGPRLCHKVETKYMIMYQISKCVKISKCIMIFNNI